jgi:hypothetical protein
LITNPTVGEPIPMYTGQQMLKGLRRPDLAAREAKRVADRLWRTKLRPRLPHDVAVKGNYWTGNVGNRAVGEVLKQRLAPGNGRVKLFSRHAKSSTAPVRIIGGGGGFHDRFGPEKLRKRLRFVAGDGGAILATGVPGIHSPEARRLLEERLPEVDLVTVRSELDRERLAPPPDCEVHVTACPTLLFADPGERSNGRTGVNFLPWFFEDDGHYDAYPSDAAHLADYFGYEDDLVREKAHSDYVRNARRICDELDDPVFVPFHKDDERFARRHLDIEVLPYTFSVAETFRRVSAVDRMVTTRFHCLVFAAVCETPTLALAYAPKVTSLADRLGISSYDLHREIPLEFDPVSNLDAVRRDAARNFELLDDYVLSNGTAPPRAAAVDSLTDPTMAGH